jgi:hypothetical protein
MDGSALILLSVCLFLVAMLYSSAGHGGASGYLAVLSFFVFNPTEMSTTSLVLNVLVSGISFFSFTRAGYFSLSKSLPFVLPSVPAAFIGGLLTVADRFYYVLLSVVLFYAAYRLAFSKVAGEDPRELRSPALLAYPTGAGIGLLSGIVGVGGGIFLSPLALFMKWATAKQTAALSAFFILVNSFAGLGGRFVRDSLAVENLWPFVLAAAAGGIVGSHVGAFKVGGSVLRRILSVVLLIASMKLLLQVSS